MPDDTSNNFGCLVMLLLIAMLFCGLAIGSTDEYEEGYHAARDVHYEQCWICW